MDRVGAGISSSIAQMRILFAPNSHQNAGLPPPPPYTETIADNPLAYQRGTAANGADVPSVYLLVIPAGKPPPSYNESMSLPDLVQSTGNANGRDDISPSTSNHFVPVTIENPSTADAYSMTNSVVEPSSASAYFPDDSLPHHHLPHPQLRFPGVLPSIPIAIYRSNGSTGGGGGVGIGGGGAELPDLPSEARSDAVVDSPSAVNSSPLRNSGVTLMQNPLSQFLQNDGAVEEANDIVSPDLQHEPSQSRHDSCSFEELPPAYEEIFTGSIVSYDSPSSYPEEEEEEEEEEADMEEELASPTTQTPSPTNS